jgi:DHA1 family bicyclomycin/chloramphenicol resistance-like MFS transporter
MQASAPGKAAFYRNAIVLGLLTAIGPFAVDMYLPALPAIGAGLHADSDSVLITLTAFFITFTIGQLIYGPISDVVGRKKPLYFGIVVFAIASVGCALAPDIETLIAFRAVQGIGGAAGMIVARAIVRDLHGGLDEVRLLSLLMLVVSISPLLAPLVGSVAIAVASWRGVFWLVTGTAGLGLVLALFCVGETRPPEARAASSYRGMARAAWMLLRDRDFMAMTLVSAFAISAFFVFLSNSSFVLTRQYGLTPLQYSLLFSLNAAAFFICSQFNGRLGARFGLRRIVRPTVWGFAAAMIASLAVTAAGIDNLAVLMAILFVGFGFLGFVMPVTSVLALTRHGEVAGTASSLMGTIQLAIGSAIIALSGVFVNGTALPMVAGIAACAAMALVLSEFAVSHGEPQPAAPGA